MASNGIGVSRARRLFSITPSILIFCFFFVAVCWVVSAEDRKPTEPTVDRTSIIIKAWRSSVWVNEKETFRWTPSISFLVNGPISAGSQLYVEYTIQPGKTWLTYNCDTGEISADNYWTLSECRSTDDKSFTNYVGSVNFSIKIKNELENTDKVLFAGKFKVKKNNLPPEQASLEYYVDYDWMMPIGLLTYTKMERMGGGGWYDTDSANPVITMWFPGDGANRGEPVAYLFYNGKKVGSSTDTDNGTTRTHIGINDLDSAGHTYRCYEFIIGKVCVYEKHLTANNLADWFHMDKNPGDYEVKVLWNGKLCRYAKFAVGPDGKIVDNGIATANNLNVRNFVPFSGNWTDTVFIIPVKVISNDGLIWDQNAWKLEALFGGPLKGFNPPQ